MKTMFKVSFCAPFLFLFVLSGLFVTLPRFLWAQSPAAMAVQRKIQGNYGNNSNGGSIPGVSAPPVSSAPSNSPQISGPASMGAGAAGLNANAPDSSDAALVPVKERVLQIISEPYFTYKGHEKAVTSIVADDEGTLALSSSLDGSIQLWQTINTLYDESDEFYDENYQYQDYNQSENGQTGFGRTQGQQTAPGTRNNQNNGVNNSKNNSTQNTLNNRSSNNLNQNSGNAYRQNQQNRTLGQNQPNQGYGPNQQGPNQQGYGPNSYSYDDEMGYGFIPRRRGNLKQPDPSDDEKEGKNGKKKSKNKMIQKKKEKIKSNLGKRRGIFERLDADGNRYGSGFCDLVVSPYLDYIYSADYNGAIRQWSLQTTKTEVNIGKTFKYEREKKDKNTFWGVAFFPFPLTAENSSQEIPFGIVAGANNNGSIYFWSSVNRRLLGSEKIHKGPIYDIQFDTTGMNVVTASGDKTAKVIALPDIETVSLLKGHQDAVYSACFSESGQYVLTTSKDKSACVWDSYSGQIVCSLIGHQGAVHRGMFLTDRLILTCSDDKTARIWEIPESVNLLPPADDPNLPQNETGMGWDVSGEEIDSLLQKQEDEDEGPEEEKSPSDPAQPNSEPQSSPSKSESKNDPALSNANEENNVKEPETYLEEDVPEQSIADAPEAYEIARFTAPSPIFSVTFNSYFLFTGCLDGEIQVWDLMSALPPDVFADPKTPTPNAPGQIPGNNGSNNVPNAPNTPNQTAPGQTPLESSAPNQAVPSPNPPAAAPAQ